MLAVPVTRAAMRTSGPYFTLENPAEPNSDVRQKANPANSDDSQINEELYSSMDWSDESTMSRPLTSRSSRNVYWTLEIPDTDKKPSDTKNWLR